MIKTIRDTFLIAVCAFFGLSIGSYIGNMIFEENNNNNPIKNLLSLDDNYIEKVPVKEVIRFSLKNKLVTENDKKVLFALHAISKFKKTFIDSLNFFDLHEVYHNKYNNYNYTKQGFNMLDLKLEKAIKDKVYSELQEISHDFCDLKDLKSLIFRLEIIYYGLKKKPKIFSMNSIFNFIVTNKTIIQQEFESTQETRGIELNQSLKGEKYLNSYVTNFGYTYIDIVLVIFSSDIIFNLGEDIADDMYYLVDKLSEEKLIETKREPEILQIKGKSIQDKPSEQELIETEQKKDESIENKQKKDESIENEQKKDESIENKQKKDESIETKNTETEQKKDESIENKSIGNENIENEKKGEEDSKKRKKNKKHKKRLGNIKIHKKRRGKNKKHKKRRRNLKKT